MYDCDLCGNSLSTGQRCVAFDCVGYPHRLHSHAFCFIRFSLAVAVYNFNRNNFAFKG